MLSNMIPLPEESKDFLNKHVDMTCPSPRSLFSRLGNQNVPDAQYTGEEEIDMYQRKTDMLSDMEAFDRLRQEEEAQQAKQE